MEEKKKTLEEYFDEFIGLYKLDAKALSKKHRIKRAEAMLLLNRFELAKMHFHLDQLTAQEKKQ